MCQNRHNHPLQGVHTQLVGSVPGFSGLVNEFILPTTVDENTVSLSRLGRAQWHGITQVWAIQVSIIEQCGQCEPLCIQLDVIYFQTCKWRHPWLVDFSCSQGLVYRPWYELLSILRQFGQSRALVPSGLDDGGPAPFLISSSWRLFLHKNLKSWGNRCSRYFCKLWSCWRGNPYCEDGDRGHREKRLSSSQHHFMKQMLFSHWVDKGIV